MQAMLSRFEQRVSAALTGHPASKDWVRKAVRRQGAARCPVRLKRVSLDVILRYGDDLADLYCRFPDDVLCIQAYDYAIGHQAPEKEPLNEVQILTQGAEWSDEWGTRWGHAYGGIGSTPVANAIPEWSQLDDYLAHRMPDPHAPGRLDRAKKVLAVHGDDKYCVAMVHLALFERLHCLRGMENTFYDLGAHEAEVQRLLEALCDYYIELIREWGPTNVSGIFMTEDWGSQTGLMISPAMWKKLFRAHYRRIFDEIHRWDKEIFFHSCGNVMRIIPELIDLGVDVLDPVQPTALNIDDVGRCFGGKIAFSGGIDDQRLEDHTPQQVKDEVRHAVDTLGKPFGNAYVLAPANQITPTVPFENIEALFEACHAQ
jgi:uroporphyrinogen decarboxylase